MDTTITAYAGYGTTPSRSMIMVGVTEHRPKYLPDGRFEQAKEVTISVRSPMEFARSQNGEMCVFGHPDFPRAGITLQEAYEMDLLTVIES